VRRCPFVTPDLPLNNDLLHNHNSPYRPLEANQAADHRQGKAVRLRGSLLVPDVDILLAKDLPLRDKVVEARLLVVSLRDMGLAPVSAQGEETPNYSSGLWVSQTVPHQVVARLHRCRYQHRSKGRVNSRAGFDEFP
jgi:hypothetical protein